MTDCQPDQQSPPDGPVDHGRRRRRRRSHQRSRHGWLPSQRRWILRTGGVLSRLLAALLLIALPILMVWDYGGVMPWSQWLATSLVLAAAVVATPAIVALAWERGDGQFDRRALLVPLLCLVAWLIAWCQTVSLPSVLVWPLSRGAHAVYGQWIPETIRSEMLDSTHRAAAAIASGWHPVSLCGQLTRSAMTAPALFAAVCLLASVLFRTRLTILLLLAAIAISGAALAFFGIADKIRAPAPLETALVTADTSLGLPFGPFVNRNNAAGYLNLTLAAAVGLLVYGFSVAKARSDADSKYLIRPEKWWDRPIFFLQNALLQIDALTVAGLILVVLSISGILASGSRGGSLAILAGVLVTCLLTGNRSARLWQPLGVVLAVGGVMMLLGSIGMIEPVRQRLETLWADDAPPDGRLGHWADCLVAFWHYLPGGAGLGAHRYAYLPYQDQSAGSWFVNADNIMVEWLVEGGLWLLPLVFAAIVWVALALGRLAEVRKAPHLTALVATGWFVIGSQLVSQFFDFGILVPAHYLTLALLVGALLGAASRRYRPNGRRGRVTIGVQGVARWAPLLLLALLALPLIDALRVTRRHAIEDHWIREVNRTDGRTLLADSILERDQIESTNPDFLNALASRSLTREVVAGERSLRRLLNRQPELAQQVGDPELEATLRARRAVYFRDQRARQAGAAAALLPDQQLDLLLQARQLAMNAMLCCPLDDTARFHLVETDFLTPAAVETSPQLLDQWASLRKRNPDVLERVIRLAAVHPGGPLAKQLVQQLLQLDAARWTAVWPYIELIGGDQVVSECLPDHPGLLLDVVESKPLQPEVRDRLLGRCRRLIDQRLEAAMGASQDAHLAYLAGRLEFALDDLDRAEHWLHQAVQLDPSNSLYRLRFVDLLEANGHPNEALEQIEILVRREPDNAQYRRRRDALLNPRRR